MPPYYYGAYLAFSSEGEPVGVISDDALQLLTELNGLTPEEIYSIHGSQAEKTISQLSAAGLIEPVVRRLRRPPKLYVICPDQAAGTCHTGPGADQFIKSFYSYFGGVFREGSPLIDSHREFLDILSKYFPPKKSTCLDAGCGSGFYTSALAQGGHKVYACDIDTARVESTKSQLQGRGRILPINSPLENLPLPSHSVDFVMCNFVLEHVADPFAVLSELIRILKPDGGLLLAVPSLNLRDTLAAWFLGEVPTLNFEHLRSYGLVPRTHPWCEPTLNTIEFLTRGGIGSISVEGVNVLSGLCEPWLSAFQLIAHHIGPTFNLTWPWNCLGQQTVIHGVRQ